MSILSLEHAYKHFGALAVIDDLSLQLGEGESLGVIGPNGAGKTTLFNLITGGIRADSGVVRLDGEPINRLPPSMRCRAGIGRTYQVPQPFTGMTVFENTLVSASFGAGSHEHQARDDCMATLARVGLADQANTLAGNLRLLDRKRLELARALCTRPRVLLLDEVAGGLTELEVQALVDTIRQIQAEGMSLIWIEHIVGALVKVVDRLMVMNLGALVCEGDPDTVLNDPEVQSIYLGMEDAG